MASGSRVRGPSLDGLEEDRTKRRKCELDLDTLDCPICMESFEAPIYQCYNGHPTCSKCLEKLANKVCPSCSLPIGTNRCVILEKLVDSLQLQCKYFVHGCKEMLPYMKEKRGCHETECKYRPLHCPVRGCTVDVPQSGLPEHFVHKHNAEIVYYEHNDEDDPDDEMKNVFTISINDSAYDRSRSQYIIVKVPKELDDDRDPEETEEDDTDEVLNEEVFLIHHQFNEKLCRYSFSLTAFGAHVHKYQLSVNSEGEEPTPWRANRTFKTNHFVVGPVYDNQKDKFLLNRLVRRGDCLFVPKLSPLRKPDNAKFEVRFQINRL
ncbi:hypothetical protein M758_11G065600 [Ceratodon purpureus]|uniref:RING-type E3 ubiquitin transferase n=1 Tax=Ceratodon purpureus TaxID=3225 RepID=A0A8T0GFL9_CERPU|nr:hypothetical protein KC19_11G067400 [Ceratodon purpureus]KAG0600848.1 hypothetical protein M758_11G065600 [Ceratodon purpureus]